MPFQAIAARHLQNYPTRAVQAEQQVHIAMLQLPCMQHRHAKADIQS